MRVARIAGAVGLLAGLVLGVPAVAGAVSDPTWAQAVPATFATDAQNAAPYAAFSSVSCASSGNCTAAGYFKDHDGNRQAFTQTSTGGVWAQAVPATFATDVQKAAPDASFNSVSCTSAGNCTAAGNFTDHDGNNQPFTQTSTGGVWAQAVPATFATDVQHAVPNAWFSSVSCTSAGNCTAAGQFKDHYTGNQAFTQTSTGGVWAQAVPATFATGIQNTAPYAAFNSVSCTSAGNCTAAGQFKDRVRDTEAFTQTSTGGVWALAVPATFAANVQYSDPYTTYVSVSCTSAGNCTAAGLFKDHDGHQEAFAQTSTGGAWALAVPATFATDVQNTAPDGYFNSVSCTSAGNCTAAGRFKDHDGHYQAITQTSTGGVWALAVPATFATDVQNAAPFAVFYSVSCTSSGNCTAAGWFYDHDGNRQAFTQTSTDGAWALAVPATFPTDVQNTAPSSYFNSVSCTSPGNCTAAGFFYDRDGNLQAFTQTSTQSAPPVLPPTGADTSRFTAVALVLLAAGAVLVAVRRRRPRTA